MNPALLSQNSTRRIAAKAGNIAYRVVAMFLLIGITYVVLYPILTMILQSISMPTDIFSAKHVWIPDNPTFDNYREVYSWFDFSTHGWITIQIVVVCTFFQMAICSLTGYGLARYRFKGNGLVFMMCILTIIVPVQTAQIPLYLDYRYFDFFGIGKVIGWFTGEAVTVNLLNTKWVYWLPAMLGVGLNAGLFTFIFRQFFKGLPKDLEDAGRVDGCNAFQVFVRVMLPNTIPVFVTVGLLSAVFYWNDTVISGMFLNLPERTPLMLYAEATREYEFNAQMGVAPEQYRAESYVIMLSTVAPLVLVYICGQRFFTECMDRSGIKG